VASAAAPAPAALPVADVADPVPERAETPLDDVPAR